MEPKLLDAVGLARHIYTSKRQRDDSRRDLAAVIAKLNTVKDENDELCSALTAICGSFLAPRGSMVSFL